MQPIHRRHVQCIMSSYLWREVNCFSHDSDWLHDWYHIDWLLEIMTPNQEESTRSMTDKIQTESKFYISGKNCCWKKFRLRRIDTLIPNREKIAKMSFLRYIPCIRIASRLPLWMCKILISNPLISSFQWTESLVKTLVTRYSLLSKFTSQLVNLSTC